LSPQPLHKADDYRLLHRYADKTAPAFAAAIVASAGDVASRITDEMVAADLTPGDAVNVLAVIDSWQVTKAIADEPANLYAAVLAPVAAKTAADMIAGDGPIEVGILADLNVTSPYVLQAANRMAGKLIVGVNGQTKRAVRRIIHDAWRDGMAPRDAARLVRGVVGLDERRAVALANYTKSVAASPRSTILTDKYAARLLKNRALTIARTETMKAANMGRQLAWKTMAERGQLPAGFTQAWIVTPDDRLCELCAPMADQKVSLYEDFASTVKGVLPSERVSYSGVEVEQPPLHPSCRCTLSGGFT